MDSVLIVQRAHLESELAFFECRIPGETLTLLVAKVGSRLQLGILPGKSRPGDAKKRPWLENVRLLGTADLRRLEPTPQSDARLRRLVEPQSDARLRRLVEPQSDARLRRLVDTLVIQRHERQLVLTAEARGLVVAPREDDAAVQPLDLEALRAAGAGLRESVQARRFGTQKSAVATRITRACGKLERRAERILGDLDKLAALERRASLAPLFLAEAARAVRGQKSLTAIDWSLGEPTPVEFPLDPSQSAQDQLEALFRRAKRAKAGRGIAESRWEDATQRAEALRALGPRVQDAATDDELATLVQQAKAIAPKDFGDGVPTRARDPQARALCYREYTSLHGESILVGRGGEHNDALTFGIARPHDLWLHSKDWPGAHVIVPLPKNKTAPQELLLDAAELAAHFSEAAGEKVIAVQIAERRHLRKPRGAPKGFVVVGREKVLELRPEPARLARLLGAALEIGGS